MNEKEINAFEDEEIVKMYKANAQTAAPDMEKLWGRIEAAVDAQEKNDEQLARQKIKSSNRTKIMRFAAAAAAFALIAYAGVVIFNSKVEKDSSPQNTPDTKAYNSAAQEDDLQRWVAQFSDTDDNRSQPGKKSADVNNDEKAQLNEAKTSPDVKNDVDGTEITENKSSPAYDPFDADMGNIVFVRCKESKDDGMDGWFMDKKGDVYKFSGISVTQDGNIYDKLEILTEEQDPVISAGKETADKFTALADKVKGYSGGIRNLYVSYFGKAVPVSPKDDTKAAEELMKLTEEIEEKLQDLS